MFKMNLFINAIKVLKSNFKIVLCKICGVNLKVKSIISLISFHSTVKTSHKHSMFTIFLKNNRINILLFAQNSLN